MVLIISLCKEIIGNKGNFDENHSNASDVL